MEKGSRPETRAMPRGKEAADGPIFLTRGRRKRMHEQYECSWCTEASVVSGEDGLKRHVESHHPDKRDLEKAHPQEWHQYLEHSKVSTKPGGKTPRFQTHLIPGAPPSDQDSMVPIPDISQAEGQPRSVPGPAVQSEVSHASGSGAPAPQGEVDRPDASHRTPSSPRNDRKRPNPDAAKDRRQKTRSRGHLPTDVASQQDPRSKISPGEVQAEVPSPLRNTNQPHSESTGSPAKEPKDVPQEKLRSDMPTESHAKATSSHPNPPIIEQGQTKGRRRGEHKPETRKSRSKASTEDDDAEPELLLQPETRPISQQQLVVEVRGIYAGLVMVEAKCIDVDNRQITGAQERDPAKKKLTPEQWRALIALHKTLLHEHHDFFLASQHPAATPMLSKLAEKYAMPSRMWRHAIHGFLEVLRHRLPDSLEFMLAFIYIAYSMIALLYETVPSFEQTWIECLGDLGRYRMSIEDDDMQDREIWSGVSRFWYSKAIDKSPKMGRLYHHLGILARPFSVVQLSLYVRSLTCEVPFPSARVSILTLFNPVLDRRSSVESRANPVELRIIRAHAIIFTGRCGPDFLPSTASLTEGLFEKFIRRAGDKFKEAGVAIAQANIGALLGYGLATPDGVPLGLLQLALDADNRPLASSSPSPPHDTGSETENTEHKIESLTDEQRSVAENLLAHASVLSFGLFEVILSRSGDKNMLPAVHIHLLFITFLIENKSAIKLLQEDIPWEGIVSFLNSVLRMPGINQQLMFEEHFPLPPVGSRRPLYEDFLIRGQRYAKGYFPERWFEDSLVDEEERPLELPSMTAPRAERILWLGQQIADHSDFILYDREANAFKVSELVRGFEPRKILEMLTPHPLPPEKRSASNTPIKEDSSPPSGEPSASAPESMGALPTRPIKEEISSSPFRWPKHEDTEMLDTPVHKAEPLHIKRDEGPDIHMADFPYKVAPSDEHI